MTKFSTYTRIGELLQKQPWDLSLCHGTPQSLIPFLCAGSRGLLLAEAPDWQPTVVEW
jgi:hypothetical protein